MTRPEDLRKAIENPCYKVISFDIFDTLVLRPSIFPTDLFTIVGRMSGLGDSFASIRRNCESLAREREAIGEEEIEFSDIYNVMKAGYDYSDEELERISKAELECEYQLLRARKSTQELFYLAKQLGKKVIIVSDIYLSFDFITAMLAHCGYEGYDKLYLSSEYKLTKSSGRLYQVVLNDFKEQGIMPSEILHIGDNERSDIASAKRQGLSAAHINRVEAVANSDIAFRRLRSFEDRRCNNTFPLGFSINRIYDDFNIAPSRETKKTFLSDKNSVTEILISPIVLTFAKWIVDDCTRRQKKEIIFINDEGRLLEQVVVKVSSYINPELAVTRCSIGNDISTIFRNVLSDVLSAKPKSNITVSDFIYSFTGVSLAKEDVSVIRNYGYHTLDEKIGSLAHYAPLINEIIKMNDAAREKNIAEMKINYPCLFDDKNAVFTIQYAEELRQLFKFTKTETNVYTLFSDNSTDSHDISSMVQFGTMSSRDLNNIRKMLEEIIGIPLGDNLGQEDFTGICNDVLNYAEQFCDLFRDYLKCLRLDSYQLYEFVRIAYYEYKDFVLKK